MTDIKFGGFATSIELLLVALAYFVYGRTLDAVFGMVILTIVTTFPIILVSIIPFAGVFLALSMATGYLYPLVFGFTGLTATWVTTLLLTIQIIIGAIVTMAATFYTIKLFWK